MKKPLPIGISDFKELIEGEYAYVDKTLLVQEILEQGTKVALIPRLRRFGKTLNLSMLRYFFEKTEEDTSYLFKHLNIWKNENYRKMQGQFPVIFITLKDVKFSSWDETYSAIKEVVSKEFQRHRYLLEEAILNPEEKEAYLQIIRKEGSQAFLGGSLLQLTEWMYRYHKKRAVILIDEYDTPAHAAYVGNYYDNLITFLRNWLSGGLKDNIYLERGILTGILRIAKESIFSGANNVETFTILNKEFQDKFGLLESEVKTLLESYDLSHKLPEVREWYDGYRIGSCGGIYNPWSVLNYIKKGDLAPYWVNTSDNALMKQLITEGTDDLKADIEQLLKGEIVEKTIEEGIVFSDLNKNSQTIWSLLLFSGYLTMAATPTYGTSCRLCIPNMEVHELYKSMIINWFRISIQESKYHLLLESLVSGDINTFSQIFQDFLLASFSVFDVTQQEPERVYHAFVLGMLIGLKNSYEIKSNRESGLGRYDVILFPKNPKGLGIIMEFKKVGRYENTNLEKALKSALQQIEEKNYAQELLDRGISRILYLAFAFEGKKVLIDHKLHAST